MTMLNDFVSEIKAGVAKQTHFTVQLTLPESIANLGGIKENMNKIILFCDQAQLPGISFSSAQVRSYGEFKEVPYEKLYEPVNLSFYVDKDLQVKKLFDAWLALIQSPRTRDFNWPKNYLTNKIDIIVQDTQNNNRYKASLFNVYPKAVAPIQLDYSAKDVMKMQVTLSYQYSTSMQLGISAGVSGDEALGLNPQMPTYNYGWDTLAEVPKDYFDDFAGFQSSVANWDFSLEGAKSYTSLENIGNITGFGGIFV